MISTSHLPDNLICCLGILQFDPSDTSIYNRLYARFFNGVMNQNLFETYINYCMNNIGNQTAEAWSAKNPGKLDNFVKWAQGYIDNGRVFGYQNDLEQKNIKINHFNEGILTFDWPTMRGR